MEGTREIHAQDLIPRVRELCVLTQSTRARRADTSLPRSVMIYIDVLDSLLEGPVEMLSEKATESWINIVPPPANFSYAEIFLVLLSSHGYCMWPSSFEWERSSDETYVSLWRLLERFALQLEPVFPALKDNMRGRTADGYKNSRGIAVTANAIYPLLVSACEGLQEYMDSERKTEAFESMLERRQDSLYMSDDEDMYEFTPPERVSYGYYGGSFEDTWDDAEVEELVVQLEGSKISSTMQGRMLDFS